MLRSQFAFCLVAAAALASCRTSGEASETRSLTSDDYHGKKYFFAFAAPLDNAMGNEVRFDVRHVGYIFTNQWGGLYDGKTLVNAVDVARAPLLATLDGYAQKLGPEDMYVQYSGGHGSPIGLEIGITYEELRDKILAMKAKEIVVFTMSCFSGGIVEAFDQRKNEWKDFKAQGRTLFVMSSSKKDEESRTGPGTDAEEPINPQGSAGSLFGHSLWKAFMGSADGFGTGGVQDGKLTLGEIRNYVIAKTQQDGHHTPVVTGIYDDGLVMATIPPKLATSDAWMAAQKKHDDDAKVINLQIDDLGMKIYVAREQLQDIEEKIVASAPEHLKVARAALNEERKKVVQSPYAGNPPVLRLVDSYVVNGDGETVVGPDDSTCIDSIFSDYYKLLDRSGRVYAPDLKASPIYIYCAKDRELKQKEISSASVDLAQQRTSILQIITSLYRERDTLRQKLQASTVNLEQLVNSILGYTPTPPGPTP